MKTRTGKNNQKSPRTARQKRLNMSEGPLKAYRYSGIVRYVLSAAYGLLLGFSVMAGNRTVNFFTAFLSVLFAYVFFKTLLARFLVRLKLKLPVDTVLTDQTVTASVSVRNYTPFAYPVSFVTVEDADAPDGRLEFFYIRPFTRFEFELPLHFRSCGKYAPAIRSSRFISAGGLVWTSGHIIKKAPPELAVLPRTVTVVNRESRGETSDSGIATAANTPEVTDSMYLRQYAPGDDPRFIHWKKSAAREDWLLKGFYQDKRLHYLVYVDLARPGGLERDLRKVKAPFALSAESAAAFDAADRLCSAALSICTALYREGKSFELLWPEAIDNGRIAAVGSAFCDNDTAFRSVEYLLGTNPLVRSDSPGGPPVPDMLDNVPNIFRDAAPGSPAFIVYLRRGTETDRLAAAETVAYSSAEMTVTFHREKDAGANITFAEVSV